MVLDPGDGPHGAGPVETEPDPAAASRVPLRSVPRLPYASLATDDGMGRWLSRLLSDGAVVLSGAPTTDGEVLRLAERVGFARPTNFGLVFDVESKPDPNSNAYTALGLEVHSDLPYYQNPPDFQLLHALVADAPGGESLLVDAVTVAEELRIADPEAFDLLASWPVPFRFVDANHDIRFTWPTIELVDGQVVGVRFNNGVRAVDDTARGPAGERFYTAYFELWRRLRAAIITVRLAAGDLLAFDNRRVLHGRAPFDVAAGRRHLQGCYIDRDTVQSRVRAPASSC